MYVHDYQILQSSVWIEVMATPPTLGPKLKPWILNLQPQTGAIAVRENCVIEGKGALASAAAWLHTVCPGANNLSLVSLLVKP